MIKNKVILDNLVVVFAMLLWALGLPILDLQQEGWDGFSLSSARALLAGLTMLGLAYFSRPVLFRRKEVLASFFLGIFGYGLASLLLVIGIGYAGAVTAAIIAALVPVISALLDVIATRRLVELGRFVGVVVEEAHYAPYSLVTRPRLRRCLVDWFVTVRRVARTLLPIAFYSMKTTI